MAEQIEFEHPPIVELVLGAQFSPLTKLTAGHLGWYWREILGAEWNEPSDEAPIEDQFENFDRPRWARSARAEFRIEPIRWPGRLWIDHRDRDRRVQIQSTRFHLNWLKREGFYPSYRRLISEFEGHFNRFAGFVRDAGLGDILVNQWELTYVDAFSEKAGWQSPADWSKVLPGLFGELATAEGLVLENRSANWAYEIPPKRGRLHISASPGRVADQERTSLLLQMTARGPVGREGVASVREGLDLGHDAALRTFLRVAAPALQQQWGTKS